MNWFLLVSVITFLVLEGSAEQCPALYKRYSKDHTYCKPDDQECKANTVDSGVSDSDIEVILKEHNDLRSKIATGKEQNQPGATNMLEMVWDDELAAVAQKHADQCVFEHDCNNCRRVQNFGVGQNLFTGSFSGVKSAPSPDWKGSIHGWYNEVKFFSKNKIEPFVASPHGPTQYGHYTQVVWATTWRVGCGYVMHKEGDKYVSLYTCNYGPGGNMKGGSMYKVGSACSACPVNSCCGSSCSGGSNYPGLCRITDDKAPQYKPTETYLFYCDFQDQKDCGISVKGTNKWLIFNTLSGNYLSIVLKGGEESTITFANTIKPTASAVCVVTVFRRGPNVDGQENNNKAIETYSIVGQDFKFDQNLPNFNTQFSPSKMSLSWGSETQIKVTFKVPAGKPEQYFEIQSIYAYNGKCK